MQTKRKRVEGGETKETFHDHSLHGRSFRVLSVDRGDIFNHLDDLHAVQDTPKDNVLSIKPRTFRACDKELLITSQPVFLSFSFDCVDWKVSEGWKTAKKRHEKKRGK